MQSKRFIMKMIEVNDRRSWKQFHRVLKTVYQNTPQYIFPLENEVESIFNPAANKAFEYGEAKVWVLLDEQRRAVGRIAAFIDRRDHVAQAHVLGGIGFFECVNEEACADALFKVAEDYLKEKK